MISLSVIMRNIFPRRKECSPKRMSFDKHSSLADLTQPSEYAFKFSLRARNRNVFTWTDPPPVFTSWPLECCPE
jgi:hypothetical protein